MTSFEGLSKASLTGAEPNSEEIKLHIEMKEAGYLLPHNGSIQAASIQAAITGIAECKT